MKLTLQHLLPVHDEPIPHPTVTVVEVGTHLAIGDQLFIAAVPVGNRPVIHVQNHRHVVAATPPITRLLVAFLHLPPHLRLLLHVMTR